MAKHNRFTAETMEAVHEVTRNSRLGTAAMFYTIASLYKDGEKEK